MGANVTLAVQGLLERNPSYVFFETILAGQVKGSAGVPLVPLASVASDRALCHQVACCWSKCR